MQIVAETLEVMQHVPGRGLIFVGADLLVDQLVVVCSEINTRGDRNQKNDDDCLQLHHYLIWKCCNSYTTL